VEIDHIRRIAMDHKCDNCQKDVKKTLHSRKDFFRDHGIDWVCEECFLDLEGVAFDAYKENNDE
jgi:ribosomal protein L37AE/L43A